MTEAPKVIWVAGKPQECGEYFSSCVEAEGEYGGTGVRYIRADAPELVALVETLRWIDANPWAHHSNREAVVKDVLAKWEALTK